MGAFLLIGQSGTGGGSSTPPNTPTLAITDNRDGTGAFCSISGAAPGSTNTVSIFSALGASSNETPELTVDVTGSGAAPLALPLGRYFATVQSVLNGLYAAPATPFLFRVSTAAASDYGGIIAAVRSVLAEDQLLTDPANGLLAKYGLTLNGVAQSPSRANSIFGAEPPGDRNFPCITLWELKIGPALPRMHDHPMAGVFLPLQISAWGTRQDLRPIITAIDNVLEGAWYGGAMDTSDWKLQDIDTSGDWMSIQVPESYAMDSGQRIVQFAKVFGVNASNKTLGIV